MELFDVYKRIDLEVVEGDGCFVFDEERNKYLDMFGGHAVISIGHTHPYYVKKLTDQLNKLAFYSNSVQLPLQNQLANKLGQICGKKITAYFYATQEPRRTKMR